MGFDNWDCAVSDHAPCEGATFFSWQACGKEHAGHEFEHGCSEMNPVFLSMGAFCPTKFSCPYLKAKSFRLCMDCIYWIGPGKDIDHAHCRNSLSPHQTTSKEGNKEYDTCLYFKTPNKPLQPTPKGG